jgi:hypothetical protein
MKNTKTKPLTPELTPCDHNIVIPTLIKLLKLNANSSFGQVGTRGVTANRIITWFNNHQGKIGFLGSFGKARLMKCINFIRGNRLSPICSGPFGYWIEHDTKVIRGFTKRERERIEAQLFMIKGMEELANEIDEANSQNTPPDALGFTWD